MRTRYADITAYTTKDGSEIRELMHPSLHGNVEQSFAEARIPPGENTLLHRHNHSEELYHVTAGCGRMTLGPQEFAIAPGDTVAIAPGTPHAVFHDGDDELVILWCCSPPYAHDDTELL